jgi:mannose-1-phosphate guanylyltransferase
MKIVIRAGGIGTRLWPMSRQHLPKQFQVVTGEKTMVRATFERVQPLFKGAQNIFLSVNKKFFKLVLKEIPELSAKNIIVETETRNTGPAVCLEVCYLEKFYPPEETIASLPADDFISDAQAFRELLLTTEEFIQENSDYILTPAIRPDYPDTGYTYFKAGRNLEKNGEEAIYEVAQVAEKPNEEYCQELIKSGVYYCHTGMYLWKLGHIVNLFKKWQPKMYEVCTQVVDFMLAGKMESAEELYSQLEKITIETAITNKEKKIAMSVSNRIGWSDLGKWHVIKKVLSAGVKENLLKGKVIVNEAERNLIYNNVDGKIIVVNNVEDLVVVDTEDALFISSLKDSAKVKKIVERLKEEGEEKYL